MWWPVPPEGWVALAVALVCVGVVWYCVLLVRRAKRHYLEASGERLLSYGSVTTSLGSSFPVSGLKLRRGAISISFAVTGPYPGGPEDLTLTGTDGEPVATFAAELPEVPEGRIMLSTGYLYQS